MFIIIDEEGKDVSDEFKSFKQAENYLKSLVIYNGVKDSLAKPEDPDDIEEKKEEEIVNEG